MNLRRNTPNAVHSATAAQRVIPMMAGILSGAKLRKKNSAGLQRQGNECTNRSTSRTYLAQRSRERFQANTVNSGELIALYRRYGETDAKGRPRRNGDRWTKVRRQRIGKINERRGRLTNDAEIRETLLLHPNRTSRNFTLSSRKKNLQSIVLRPSPKTLILFSRSIHQVL